MSYERCLIPDPTVIPVTYLSEWRAVAEEIYLKDVTTEHPFYTQAKRRVNDAADAKRKGRRSSTRGN